MSFILGSSKHSPTPPGISNVIGVSRCPLRTISKIRPIVWCLGDGHRWQVQGKLGATNIIIYVYLSICIIKVRYTDMKLQGLANLPDPRKDYEGIMMQLMVDRKLKISHRSFLIFFFYPWISKIQDFHRYVNSTAQTFVRDKNNSASVQHLFSPCPSARNTRQSVT